jgi:transcriptional regulator with XRE-family HTH domain
VYFPNRVTKSLSKKKPARRVRRALPARELQICRRLRKIRELHRLTQQEFAAEVGIKRPRLASYEECRAPVRFDLALRICRQYVVSEKWLATGEGDWRLVMDLGNEAVVARIPADMNYGEAYDLYLAKRYEVICSEQAGNLRIMLRPGDPLVFYKNLFFMLLERWNSFLAPEEMVKLFSHLAEVGLEIVTFRVQRGSMPELVKGTSADLPQAAAPETATAMAARIKSELENLERTLAPEVTKKKKALREP